MVDWKLVLGHVVRNPTEHHCPMSPPSAQKLLRCSAADLRTLTQAYGVAEGEPFDAFDVWNIGLYSGSGRSQPEIELAYMKHLLREEWTAPAGYAITAEARCPREPECAGAWRMPAIDGVEWKSEARRPGTARWSGVVHRRGTSRRIYSSLIVEIWRTTLARYRFHLTHPAIEELTAVTRKHGVGNCLGLSHLLAEDLGQAGIRCRIRNGFIWGGIKAEPHHWVEALDSDGEWKTLDISMATLAGTFFSEKFQQFCLGSMLSRVISVGRTTVLHYCDDKQLDVEFTVRRHDR